MNEEKFKSFVSLFTDEFIKMLFVMEFGNSFYLEIESDYEDVEVLLLEKNEPADMDMNKRKQKEKQYEQWLLEIKQERGV